MAIAIDYDGTIADTNRAKARWILRRLGKQVPNWACNATDCVPIVGADVYSEMGDAIYGREHTLRTAPVPGALEALRALAAGTDVYVVTARTPERVEFAREWIERMRALDCIRDVLTSRGTTKYDVCSRIGATALIDDDVRHLREAGLAPRRRVLFHEGREEKVDYGPGITLCRSWDEVLRLLERF